MERLPSPPNPFPVPALFHACAPGLRVWRIYFRGGQHPMAWHEFRHFGPTAGRFDHHAEPKRRQSRGILYATAGTDAFLTALAEVFQETRHIDRHLDDPWLVVFALRAPLQLLDTSGEWPVRAGGNMAIHSGSRKRARDWSRAIYRDYGDADGIWYPSSLTNRSCLALYERAKPAMPAGPVLHEALDSPKLVAGLTQLATRLRYTMS